MTTPRKVVFLYGTLKPDQIGHDAVRSYLTEPPVKATLPGFELFTRDGLPFIREGEGSVVHGVAVPASPKLLGAIREYEGIGLPRNERLYTETVVTIHTSDSSVEAFTYVAKGRRRRRDELVIDSGVWATANDPVLTRGFPHLMTAIDATLTTNVLTFPGRGDYWLMFWEMQGHYLNLTGVLERFCRFAYGTGVGPNAAIKRLDEDWAGVFIREPVIDVSVHSARTSDSRTWSTTQAPFSTWYQVRSNILHQGKSTRDFERLRNAVAGLRHALEDLLRTQIPELATMWDDNRG